MNEQVTPVEAPLETTFAGKRHHSTGTTTGTYDGRELKPYQNRPRAMDAFELPSLMAGQRVYRSTKEQS